ncbi:MAG: Rpn family recombination-promoting nuclease/putative transposase [Deltaproteobacteria bacterium]|nr:Rpn family recombination-promoting nuclease/putative transposase [Deltaproteobacteria bacterium]
MVFKILFAAPENRDLLISLLTAVLQPSSPIASVDVLNPEMPKDLVTDKGAVLDLRLALGDGRQIDVEMQAELRPGMRSRALYYWARMYGAQLRPGMAYDELQPCVAIFILGYAELPSSRFHCTFQVLEVHGGERLSDQLEVHMVELPKLPARGGGQSEEALLEDWGRFLWARSDQELEEVAMSNPVMAKAKGALDSLSAQPEVQELARQRELALSNWATGVRTARAEGQVEGRAAALVAMLEARGLSVSDAQRARITGCTDIATLDRWIVRAATAGSAEKALGHE